MTKPRKISDFTDFNPFREMSDEDIVQFLVERYFAESEMMACFWCQALFEARPAPKACWLTVKVMQGVEERAAGAARAGIAARKQGRGPKSFS